RAIRMADARALVEETLRLDTPAAIEALARRRVSELVPAEPAAVLGSRP
ncbi:MAG: hypothetical protein HYS34_02555, partial [Acidobacteria bacterium]|nr:hypothetical protein [Acidobacteriota bacterium]